MINYYVIKHLILQKTLNMGIKKVTEKTSADGKYKGWVSNRS